MGDAVLITLVVCLSVIIIIALKEIDRLTEDVGHLKWSVDLLLTDLEARKYGVDIAEGVDITEQDNSSPSKTTFQYFYPSTVSNVLSEPTCWNCQKKYYTTSVNGLNLARLFCSDECYNEWSKQRDEANSS